MITIISLNHSIGPKFHRIFKFCHQKIPALNCFAPPVLQIILIIIPIEERFKGALKIE